MNVSTFFIVTERVKLDEVLSVISDSGYRGLRGEGLLSDDTRSREALVSGAVADPNGAKTEQHDKRNLPRHINKHTTTF